MGARRFLAALIGLALLARGAPGEARQLAAAAFGGKGWNQAEAAASLPLPVAFAGTDRGAIVFDLRRTGDIPFSRPETVFTLADGAGGALLRLKVCWASDAPSGNPVLVFQGRDGGGEYRSHGMGLWGPFVELDRPVALGESIHVELTWDDAARVYGVYVDGREQPAQYGGFDPVQHRWSPEQRPLINREREKDGKPKPFDARPLSYFLSRVATVQLGNSESADRHPARRRSLLVGAFVDNVAVFADEIPPPAAGPTIEALSHDAGRVAGFSGKLVAGDSLTVSVRGTPGATGTFDVVYFPDLGRSIPLDWRGWGVYLEEKPFLQDAEVDLRQVEGYRVYVRAEPFDPLAPGFEPAAELGVREQRYVLENLEIDTPYYVAVVAALKDGTVRPILAPIAGRPLAEGEPGVYNGSWQASYQDRYPRAAIVGRLQRGAQVAALVGADVFAVDPALSVAVTAEPAVLRADEQSTAKVTVAVTDANGNAVRGHEIRFLLATTSQYTGVVGGGAFAEQVGGAMRADQRAVTDIFGRAEATYVAGFAAKTALIVARDMTGGGTGAAVVRTFIEASAQLELEPAQPAAALAAGYEITVTSSDAWLTADGKSQARITALVTFAGKPVEGRRVAFEVAAGGGQVRAVSETTGRDGQVRALYTAGRKIGPVLVTATDTAAGISGSVQIELRSDAPAKIAVAVDPARLPADGRSRATVLVTVTDVNDNPNDDVEVEYAIAAGDGGLKDERGRTDRRGENATTYTAGRTPGTVTFGITVRSTPPTEAELDAARSLAVAVPDYSFY